MASYYKRTFSHNTPQNMVLEVIEDDRGSNDKTGDESRGNKMAGWGGVADLSFPKSKTRRGRVQHGGQVAPAVMASNQEICKLEADEAKKYRVRKLTPRECWRLMGFKDQDFNAAAAVNLNSNTHLYAQAGNAIVKNVLEEIFKQMIPQETRG